MGERISIVPRTDAERFEEYLIHLDSFKNQEEMVQGLKYQLADIINGIKALEDTRLQAGKKEGQII